MSPLFEFLKWPRPLCQARNLTFSFVFWSYDREKIIAQTLVFNGADPECWQRRTVYLRPTDTRIVTVICCKVSCVKFQQYFILRFSKRHLMWKIPVLSIYPSRYENAIQTSGQSSLRVLYNVSTTGSKERLCQRRSSKNHWKNVLFEEFETLQT